MRFGVSANIQRNLARSAAVLLVGGMAAGCSSDVLRFQDSILTGSARLQQPAPASQPYPGDVAQLDQNSTGSVGQANVMNREIPVPRPEEGVGQGGMQVASAPQQQFPNPRQPGAPSTVASAPLGNVDPTATGGTASARPAPATQAFPSGGTITVQPGDTLYGLARRHGVSPNAIMAANGMSDANSLRSGQQLTIPGSNGSAQVADARSNGQRDDNGTPGERLAVLPQQPKLKEGEAGAPQTASNASGGQASGGGAAYTVVAGDTLNGIARKTGANIEALKRANGLDSGLIRIGQTLTIPAGGNASVQVASAPKVDTMTTSGAKAADSEPEAQVAAYTPPTKAEKVINQATAEAPDATGIGRMRWPVRGRVVDGFGGGSGSKANDGIDIAVPEGTPIKSAENGVVIYAGDGLKEFGNTVLVRHEDGLVTVYGHASELKVERGQKVRRGEELALAGMSGSADRPKLHFEVRKDSAPVDPIGFLE